MSNAINTLHENLKGIILTYFGAIHLTFFSSAAPKTVLNFKRLADDGFYSGLLFHRIIPDYLIQGGDPLSRSQLYRSKWGLGGPGWSIIGEFNKYRYTRGMISMARQRGQDSGGSQFFIVLKNLEFLSGFNTVFGKVTSGMEFVDQIASLETDAADAPIEIEKAIMIDVRVDS